MGCDGCPCPVGSIFAGISDIRCMYVCTMHCNFMEEFFWKKLSTFHHVVKVILKYSIYTLIQINTVYYIQINTVYYNVGSPKF